MDVPRSPLCRIKAAESSAALFFIGRRLTRTWVRITPIVIQADRLLFLGMILTMEAGPSESGQEERLEIECTGSPAPDQPILLCTVEALELWKQGILILPERH